MTTVCAILKEDPFAPVLCLLSGVSLNFRVNHTAGDAFLFLVY